MTAVLPTGSATAPLLDRFAARQPSSEQQGISSLLWLASLHRDNDAAYSAANGLSSARRIADYLAEQTRIRDCAAMVATTISRTKAICGQEFGPRWDALCAAVDARESHGGFEDLHKVLGDVPRTEANHQAALARLDDDVRVAVLACYWGSTTRRPVEAASAAVHGETL